MIAKILNGLTGFNIRETVDFIVKVHKAGEIERLEVSPRGGLILIRKKEK